MANKFNESLERKIYENPKITISIIVIGLLIFGFLIGMGFTVNIFYADHTNTIIAIEHASDTTGLMEINGTLYHIQEVDEIFYNGTFISETTP